MNHGNSSYKNIVGDIMVENYLYQLKKNTLFKNIESSQILELMNKLKPKIVRYKADEVVVLAGSTLNELGVVVFGEVSVTKTTPNADVTLLNNLKEGELFGEIVALSGDAKSPVSVVAKSDCTIVFLNPSMFFSMDGSQCSAHAQFIQNAVMTLAKKALTLNRKIDYLVIKSLRGKVCAVLSDFYEERKNTEITLPFNRNDFADLLNVSRPSLSRELGRMKDDGLINFKGKKIEILNLESIIRWS